MTGVNDIKIMDPGLKLFFVGRRWFSINQNSNLLSLPPPDYDTCIFPENVLFFIGVGICLTILDKFIGEVKIDDDVWSGSRVGLRADHIAGCHNRTNPAGTEPRPTILSSFIFD